ncbi:MAG: efflux RND transporter periplasmic adaptor subunit [Prochloraceae cyanobacterium]|nr:efflux RND transporter periplasmic adaptor subunit [Prochloraceae cyanobacterium]
MVSRGAGGAGGAGGEGEERGVELENKLSSHTPHTHDGEGDFYMQIFCSKQRDMEIVQKSFKIDSLRILLVVTIVGLIGTGTFLRIRQRTAIRTTVKDLTVAVESKTLTIRVEASGTVVPIETVNISPELSGRLVALYVDRGDRVKTGQILARMRSTELEARLAQAKAQLAEARAEHSKLRSGNRSEEIERAKAQVTSARSKVTLTAKRVDRYRYLVEQGAEARDKLDEVISEDETTRAGLLEAEQKLQELKSGYRKEDVQQAAARVRSYRAQIQQIEAQLDGTVIRAPFDGIVTQKYASVGAIVTPTTSASATASATSSSILTLTKGLEILAEVPEANISRIKLGQRVEIVADSYPDRAFEGRVRQIAPEAVVENNVTSFQIRVELITGKSELLSGMNADAIFIGKSVTDALMVPTVAITTRNNRMGVLVADEGGRAKFQPVTVGVTQEGKTQIIQGLTAKERVFIDFPEGIAE